MTVDQMQKFLATLIAQVGLDPEKADKSLDFWKPNLVQIDFDKSIEGIKVILLNDTVKVKDPGKWISQVVRYCGGSEQVKKKEVNNPVTTGCQQCQESGVVEVPHRNDWVEGVWRGEYTMTVACDCGFGQMRACQMMNIRQYESLYQNWRIEYPLRRHQWQLAMITNRPVPLNPEDKEKRSGRIYELQQLIKAAS